MSYPVVSGQVWFQFAVCFDKTLRPDFTSKLEHGLTFGTPKFYIAPCDKINHRLVNLSCSCDVKSGLRFVSGISNILITILVDILCKIKWKVYNSPKMCVTMYIGISKGTYLLQ